MVGMRELQQNPGRVIERVLAGGEDVRITASGEPTGVKLVPEGRSPQRWASGAALHVAAALEAEAAQTLKAELTDVHEDEARDPWAGQA